ncbi:MAG: hypothetical protein ACI8TP_000866 [Acidimicrobiales bacterium]|jgi:hypothetical protein
MFSSEVRGSRSELGDEMLVTCEFGSDGCQSPCLTRCLFPKIEVSVGECSMEGSQRSVAGGS